MAHDKLLSGVINRRIPQIEPLVKTSLMSIYKDITGIKITCGSCSIQWIKNLALWHNQSKTKYNESRTP